MKKELKVFKVANTKQITPNMIRITLVGKWNPLFHSLISFTRCSFGLPLK